MIPKGSKIEIVVSAILLGIVVCSGILVALCLLLSPSLF